MRFSICVMADVDEIGFFTQAEMFSEEFGIETRAARMIEKMAVLSFQQV